MLGLVFVSLPLKHVFIVFTLKKKKKKEKEKRRRCKILFYFSFDSFQILHVFLPNIPVQCALLEYAYV
jgi:hypothetical protein